MRLLITLTIICFLLGCIDDTPPSTETKPKNIILFIGDGMGGEHRKAARWLSEGEKGMLHMDSMPISGFLSTSSASDEITDSAAAATAMATGVKTNNGLIGLDINMKPVPSVLEDAKRAGKVVGLITTTQITHATPAAFSAHVEHRSQQNNIAEQMLLAQVDILLGGGENFFIPEYENGCFPEIGQRHDGVNLINEAIINEYVFVCHPADFELVDPISTKRLIGLFSDEGMARPFSPSLKDMTQKAIDILSNNDNGFFLMVEGGQIDWASHDNNASDAIADTLALDEAVQIAKQFASINNDTLIIVTADHETGGMNVSWNSSNLSNEDGPFSTPSGNLFYVNWSKGGHTSVDVPLTALGPLAYLFEGSHENTYVHDVIVKAF